MPFNYDKKEQYTQADLDKLLAENESFAKKDLVPKAELEENQATTEQQLKQLRSTLFDRDVTSALSSLPPERHTAIRSMSNLTGNETPQEIKAAFDKTIKDNPWLKPQQSFTDPLAVRQTNPVDPPKKKSPYIR